MLSISSSRQHSVKACCHMHLDFAYIGQVGKCIGFPCKIVKHAASIDCMKLLMINCPRKEEKSYCMYLDPHELQS